jgi:hypothetical protein
VGCHPMSSNSQSKATLSHRRDNRTAASIDRSLAGELAKIADIGHGYSRIILA